MISKKDILKMVHHVTRHTRGQSERKTINPYREWFIGISLFIAIATAGSVFDAQKYVHYDTLESTVVDTTPPVKKYNASTASVAKDMYMQRLSSFESLIATAPIIPEVESEAVPESEESIPDDEEVDVKDLILE